MSIKELFYRATHRPDGSYINPLAHIFFYMTFVFGVAFTFFGNTETVRTAVLYSESERQFGPWALSAWGIVAMIVTILNTYMLIFRKAIYIAPIMGFALWLYAVMIYFMGDFYFQIVVAAVPNLVFWAWWYIRVRRYIVWWRSVKDLDLDLPS